MKLNLTNVQVTAIDGSIETIDFSKQIGNLIYTSTKDMGEVIIAQELYKTGEAEVTEEQLKSIQRYFENFPYIIKKALLDA